MTDNHSIRYHLSRMNTTTRKTPCVHLVKVTHIVKDRTGSGNDYNDNYYNCSKLKRRLKSKRECKTCNLYKPLNAIENDNT
jgi:hypothetical protein